MAFTFFFRDLHVLDLVVEHATPILVGRSFARIWDAGCAMGPEPYSLAILFAEKLGPFGFKNLRVFATDLDDCETFGNTIVQGVYPDQELERVPAGLRERYFEPFEKPGYSRVVERVRSRLQFARHDLLSLRPVGDGFSLVVCKNVLLHFSAAQRIEVLRMFHASLAPGGLLAMEQTQALPEELSAVFERVVPDGQLFRKRENACG
jgi:chemotaxis protein methyltransferase CheR